MSSYQEYFKKVKGSRSAAKARRKSKFPYGAVIVMAMIAGFLGIASTNFDYIEKQFVRLELSFFGPALAAEESSKTSVNEAAKGAGAGENNAKVQCPDPTSMTSEEMSHFSKLSERKKELDLRELELNALEEELHKQRQEVEARIAKLERIRGEIGSVLKERIAVDEERVTRLVDFYSNMKPKQAAEIFNDLNESLAIEVLGRMKKKNAAEIMNLLEPKKAQTLSEKFAGYKRR